ncbi:diguanylate cyclase domain-containing protein [Paenibacillus xanthanilyticus]|uniref:Diguanylate cyclase domain-containing protein n=1 Tax=Paenibacillus xanthanilyticus TaxID=1783531 RepID=A0ABV8K7F9_9BACL
MTDASPKRNKELLNRELLTDGEYALNVPVDLTNCEKEPIHIPGRIQPHGVLLAFSPAPEFRILQCSRNASEHLGVRPEELLNRPLLSLLGEAQTAMIAAEAARAAGDPYKLRYMDVRLPADYIERSFCGILHESDGLLILELEPSQPDEAGSPNDFEWIQTFFGQLKQADNRVEASRIAAEQIKLMLGYDRVMIYEFDAAWNGKVIAEAKAAHMEPFLGHQYPASDIPKQARALYLRNWLRTIVDVHYEPVDLVPALRPDNGQPLNLSLSTLRSVSPMHIEYLQNMGVGATVTISLIHNNELWGLITCHHETKKYVPHRVRNLCNFLGEFFSRELYQRQQLDNYEAELRLKSLSTRIASIFIGEPTPARIMEQLEQEQSALLALMSATGAAVSFNNHLALYGDSPSAQQVIELAAWAKEQAVDHAYHTSRLPLEFPPAAGYKANASGMLYLALSGEHRDFILWFRPEIVHTVEWAGDPAKAVIQAEDGQRISPRKSFEKWLQTVDSSSAPWLDTELRLLPELKAIIFKRTQTQLRQAEELAEQHLQAVRDNEKRYLQLMEYSPVAFFAVTDGKIVYANQQAAELVKAAQAEDLIGRRVLSLLRKESQLAAQVKDGSLSRTLVSTVKMTVECFGAEYLLETSMAQVIYNGKPSILAIARQVEQKKGAEDDALYRDTARQLQSIIETDALTEMPNRRFFENRLLQAWDLGRTNGHSVSVLIIDIDGFKTYNALFGLQGGDTCIQWIADVLRACAGSDEEMVIARYEGGTFTVLFSGRETEQTVALAEQIRQGVLGMQIPRSQGGSNEYVTVSIGVATTLPSALSGPADLFHAAQKSLRAAKSGGRNLVVHA